MILNWFLLLLTAFLAYTTGSLSTRRLASRFLFKRDLTKLGKGNVWISNFRRLFGPLGFVKLALAEIVKDLLPLLIGALLIGFRGRADIGIAFAGYCLMLGRLWPVFNRFRGCHGCIALIFCNSRELFHFSYQRYLENQIRAVFGLEGTPVRIVIRQKGDSE